MPQVDASQDRYVRQRVLEGFGSRAQEQLAASTVLLVGLGGLGTPAAAYLTAAGVGHIIINDFDTVHQSNLHRQILYREQDLGRRKPEAACQRLREMNSETQVTVVDGRLDAKAMLTEVDRSDLVIDATDNFASRLLINESCVARSRPLVSGAAAGTDGQLGVFPCDEAGPCYRCFQEGIGDNLADCEGTGILGPVTGVIGSMMAMETIKLLAGFGVSMAGRLAIYDGKSGDWKTLKLSRNPFCQACGDNKSDS